MDETRVSSDEYEAHFGASPRDVVRVRDFATRSGLDVVDVIRRRRVLRVRGLLRDLSRAFGTTLAVYGDSDTPPYRGRDGSLTVPREMADFVVGVFGLDSRPQARPHFLVSASPDVTYSPIEVATAYQFPTTVTGAGECIGLVELGGGYRAADLEAFFSALRLTVPSVTAVSVDGGANSPSTPDSADGEVLLDIEVAGAVAPGASIAVYFAPNTDQGFLDAVSSAVHDPTNRPSVLSISWGGPESTWTTQAMNQMEQIFTEAATLGVTITVAAGDSGSTDGVTDGLSHVNFPASAPHALACGGTSLRLSDGTIASEVVWDDSPTSSATGGGVSAVFALPSYQSSADVPPSVNPGHRVGRGVPDVAGDADPDTGYDIRVDGESLAIGGTSAVAPLWAGLVALLNEGRATSVGFLQPWLYADAPVGSLRDITVGTNGAYSARVGWDACTGLGSPVGSVIREGLSTPPTREREVPSSARSSRNIHHALATNVAAASISARSLANSSSASIAHCACSSSIVAWVSQKAHALSLAP
jgi:kumamolisin